MHIHKNCIVCGFSRLHPIYHQIQQPLGALNLPKSKQAAMEAIKLPMDYYACGNCGHIFNVSFDYGLVPYEEGSNLMYNASVLWNEYLGWLVSHIHKDTPFENKKVIEIGCGNGVFLNKILDQFPTATCYGFDPSIDIPDLDERVIGIKDYFNAERDIIKYKPDILVCRHVIEHLSNPYDFMADISFWCAYYDHYPLFVLEVPRINKAIEQKRTTDFIYEHVSNFTDKSFSSLIERSQFEILYMGSHYDDEVLLALIKPKANPLIHSIERESKSYYEGLLQEKKDVKDFLSSMDGHQIAFWGATGKGATFFNAFHVDVDHFPLVVDSDDRKCGFYVPGTGQLIQHASLLKDHPVDHIFITTPWRVKDIYYQIKDMNIPYKNIFYVGYNQVLKYQEDDHATSIAI